MLKIHRPSQRMKYSRRTKEEISDIVEDYLAGVLIKDIVYKHSISSTTINKLVQKAGYKLRKPFEFDWNQAKRATAGVRKNVLNNYGRFRKRKQHS